MMVPSAFILSACGGSGHKHDWQWYTSEQTHWRACSTCGEVWIEEESHHYIWDEMNGETHRGYCLDCHYIFDGEHTWSDDNLQCTTCEFSIFEATVYSSTNDDQQYCSVRLNPYLLYDVNLENYADLVIPSRILVNGEYHKVTNIDSIAFEDCSWIRSVTIPNTITSVGWGAFQYCQNLTTVNWGENVKEVYSYTFRGCSSLETINRTSKVETIEYSAFANTSLNELSDENWASLKKIEGSAFDKSKLSSVTLSSSVSSVGMEAFSSCENLKTITLLNKDITGLYNAFIGCDLVESITMPSHINLHEIFGRSGGIAYLPESLKTVNIINSKDNTIPNGAFRYSYIENITLPEGITTIGAHAFADSALKNVNIPTTVTSIGSFAFSNANLEDFEYKGTLNQWIAIEFENSYSNPTTITKSLKIDGEELTDINISGVSKISNYAFSGCTSLNSATISNDLTQIGKSAFSGCTNLTELTTPYVSAMNIPSSLTTLTITSATQLDKDVFKSCSKLTKLTLPSNLTTVCGCKGLTTATQLYYSGTLSEWANINFENKEANPTYYTKNLYINDAKVTEIASLQSNIKQYAFINCTDITKVELSNATTQVGADAFSGCTNVSQINYTGTIDQWVGINFASETSNPTYFTQKLHLNNKEVTKVELSSATSIAPNSFVNCSSITEVELTDTITSIGAGAFNGCTGLTKLNYTGTIEQWVQIYFGDEYANPIYAIKKLYINNEEVAEIKIEQSTSISQYAFVNLRYRGTAIPIAIGDQVKSIGAGAFKNCFAICNYAGTIAQWAQIAFADAIANPNNYCAYFKINNQKLTTITTEDLKNVTSISDFAFYNLGDLQNVTLPSSLKSIGNSAFANCKNLQEITFASGIKTIGNSAFANCSSLKQITLSSELESIGNSAFASCTMLENATLSSGLKTIGERAFEKCSSLKQITLSSGLESIGVDAFVGCSSLAKTNFNGTASQWAQVDFKYNYNNTGYDSNPIRLSKNLYLNGELATRVEIKDIEKISNYAFEYCESLLYVTIDNVETIGGSAFEYCYRLIKVITGNSVTNIDTYAFAKCYSLSSVTIGKNVNDVSRYAFGWCYNLFEVYNLSSLSLSTWEFSYAKDIYTSLDSPSKLSEDAGFIIYTNGADKILVGYEGSDRTLTLPQGITEIGKYVFYGCSWIEHIIVPDGVTTIDKSAFEECSNLKTIILPTSITKRDSDAFSNSGLNAIYYKGTAEEWENVENWSTNIVYYYSDTKPTDNGKYWHYDTDGKTPVVWEE